MVKNIIIVCLLFVSVWNAGSALHQSFHWPLSVGDNSKRLDQSLTELKNSLGKLPEKRIEYRIEEASRSDDSDAFFTLQYILLPVILHINPGEDRYVLVEFASTKKVKPVPGLILLRDFGHGFALYTKK
jgi:hypothetical protein